jgi:hypothetical protein
VTSALQVWRELARGPASEPGWNARRVAAVSGAGILIAVRKPGDVPALLIEVSTLAVPPIAEYPSAEGFHVVPESIVAGPRGQVRLCLLLSNGRYRDVFGVLVDDVVEDISARAHEDEIVRAFLARLREWQVFMRRHGSGPLSVENQIGLFAELLFLRDHVLTAMPALSAIGGWVGPLGRPQDFQLEQVALEVKASVGGIKEVQISSLIQLDTTLCGTPIVLCWVDLASAAEPLGIHLPRLVSELKGIISGGDGAALKLFEERLLELGYLEAHERHYAERLYRLRAMTFYSVSGAFPRIERGEVRQGVISGSYVIGLAGCEGFEIPAAEADRLVRGGSA